MAAKCFPEEELEEEQFSVNNLPKAERKFTWNQRNSIIKKGKSLKHNSLIISVAKQKNWQLIITLRSSFKGAVTRNRTKRIIREVYRNCKPLFRSPVGMVVTVLHSPKNLDYHRLQDRLIEIFIPENEDN